ncbi:type II toxin-antitoxin system HipA family toxin [Arcobacter sp. YIC-80]|uniref:type II toxin-antitoxin system HipA family toxin n=1 Tax=Arcobacter sp. YIC-80 TaxID=3376683 RepID=UPI00384E77D9
MPKCYACLEEKKLKSQFYCKKCIDEVFGGVTPEPLDFDKKDFYIQRNELAHRMSISGVEDKLSLTFNDNRLKVTATNGSYILKPVPMSHQIKNQEDVAANEHLSMLISKKIFKIDTANCAVIPFRDGELAYITKRFDYTKDGTKYDQEDFASILDVNSAKDGADYKYDAKTYLDCANAIKLNVPASIVTLEDFFKRILLNYLIANGDAHLKNFSLYSLPDSVDYRLTPNYDLLNTRFHVNEKYGDTALALFDDYSDVFEQVGYYTFYDFKLFATYLGINEKRFNKILTQVNSSITKVEDLINASFLSDEGKVFYLEKYKERLKRVNYQINK